MSCFTCSKTGSLGQCPHCNKLFCSRPCQLAAHVGVHFLPSIEKSTLENESYRKILNTTPQMQLVLMSLKPFEKIPMEKHDDTTQFIRVESGQGQAVVDGKVFQLQDGSSITISGGQMHEIQASSTGLKLYTLYSPPVH